MAQPYVGEVRMFAGNFAPAGWAFCSGQLMAISENETLFQLIGTTYGGDGQNTFALPDLRGRSPMHMGQGPGLSSYQLSESGGVESVTLTIQQIPTHSHAALCSTGSGSNTSDPANGTWSTSDTNSYFTGARTGFMGPQPNGLPTTVAGQSQPHDNMNPFLCISFIISLFGIFPSPT